nr:hypothetical protein CFP56_36435 [Quercus suber]
MRRGRGGAGRAGDGGRSQSRSGLSAGDSRADHACTKKVVVSSIDAAGRAGGAMDIKRLHGRPKSDAAREERTASQLWRDVTLWYVPVLVVRVLAHAVCCPLRFPPCAAAHCRVRQRPDARNRWWATSSSSSHKAAWRTSPGPQGDCRHDLVPLRSSPPDTPCFWSDGGKGRSLEHSLPVQHDTCQLITYSFIQYWVRPSARADRQAHVPCDAATATASCPVVHQDEATFFVPRLTGVRLGTPRSSAVGPCVWLPQYVACLSEPQKPRRNPSSRRRTSDHETRKGDVRCGTFVAACYHHAVASINSVC